MRIGIDTLVENPRRPSSAIHYLQQMIRTLACAAPEHELVVFVSAANQALFTFQAPNVRYVRCAASNENIPLRVLIQQAQYPLLARRLRLDVIHALNQIPLLAPCATVVKICTLHHHEPALGRSALLRVRRGYRRAMHDSSARRATLVMANSETTRRGIIEHMRVPAERVQVVYEAVDDEFGAVTEAVQAHKHLARAFGIEREYVLYVSQLFAHKNPDGALRAFAHLRAQHGADLDLVFAGPDNDGRLNALRALAADLGVGERIHFLGRVSKADLIQLYAAARVFVYPSFNETFGKPLVEAMRSGVPIVTSNASSMPEIVADGGLCVDPRDPQALADALHRALVDEALRARLRAAGLARARDFSWERTAAGTLEMCLQAARLWRAR